MPELVGRAPLVAWSRDAWDARPVRAVAGQEAVDRAVAHGDAAPSELGRDAMAIPIAQETHEDDGPLEGRVEVAVVAGTRTVDEAGDAIRLEVIAPAEERRSAATSPTADRRDVVALRPFPQRPPSTSDDGRETPPFDDPRGPSALRGEEQEARSLLVVVSPRQAPRVRPERHAHLPRARTLPSLICPGELQLGPEASSGIDPLAASGCVSMLGVGIRPCSATRGTRSIQAETGSAMPDRAAGARWDRDLRHPARRSARESGAAQASPISARAGGAGAGTGAVDGRKDRQRESLWRY